VNTPSVKTIWKVCAAALILLLLPLGQALAADITVDADCSLQNAIRSANEGELVEPRADCEAGDADSGNAQVDDDGNAIPAGLDTITIEIAGTVDGVITLDETLSVTSHIAIDGGGLAIDGAGNQIFKVTAGSLAVDSLNLQGGWSETSGGAIAVSDAAVTLTNTVVSNSGAKEMGGGIYAVDSDLALIDSAVASSATGRLEKPEPTADGEDLCHRHDDGGAQAHAEARCHRHDGATAQAETTDESAADSITWDTFGGGIYFEGEENSLMLERSGLDANVSHSSGGGVYIASGSASIKNSTISGNTAGADGGGIYNAGASTLAHVTVVDNYAANIGGIVDASELLLYNSILSGNAGGDCTGTLNALIGNLIRDGSCGHDGLTGDPMLLLLDGVPPYYVPQDGSPALDAASPDYCLLADQRGIVRAPNSCDIGAAEYAIGAFSFQIQSALALLNPPGSGGGAGADDAEAATPVPSLCASLPGHYKVVGYTYSSHCKMADHLGIGNQMLVNNGAIDAVDIFGWVARPLTMCFQRPSGAIVLLDAATSPREIVPLQTWTEDGWKCATVDRNGTAVLMPDEFFASGIIPEQIWDLTGCTVTTTEILNLRSEPNGESEIVGNVLNNETLTADKRANRYYRVNYYDRIGWLSSSYLTMSGACE
jgi:hypothetical protein